jgi:hypothetical protein
MRAVSGHSNPMRAAIVTALLATGALPHVALAGEWHRLRDLRCSDCHTMHNSTGGGAPMRYDGSAMPAAMLLRAGSATELCLACHSGSTTAPSVTTPTDFDPPGGGFPADLADPDSHAHALGTSPVIPPDGDTAVVMSCTTCHDPHGNGNYRNLRPSPSGTGRSAAVPVAVDQAVTANGFNAASVYLRSNLRYRTGFSSWCMDCHNLIAGTHMPEIALASEPTVLMSHWLNDPITNRIPVQNPTDAAVPSMDDTVFCLSCHKAHGTPHFRAMLWADGEAAGQQATCAQCHGP